MADALAELPVKGGPAARMHVLYEVRPTLWLGGPPCLPACLWALRGLAG